MKQEIYLAGGCFWGLEKYLSLVPGVVDTQVGYANGSTENPSYEEVCTGHTGHAETVLTTYDDSIISLYALLGKYFEAINPLSVNRQGGDMGTQYRTGIYYTREQDLEIINRAKDELEARLGQKCAIEVKPLTQYASAEEYHQKYLDRNPGGYCHISPHKMELAKEIND